jgi:hypothetical protein
MQSSNQNVFFQRFQSDTTYHFLGLFEGFLVHSSNDYKLKKGPWLLMIPDESAWVSIHIRELANLLGRKKITKNARAGLAHEIKRMSTYTCEI